jgi:hypothetical protein
VEVTIATLEGWISTTPARTTPAWTLNSYSLNKWYIPDVELSAAAVNVRGLGKDGQSLQNDRVLHSIRSTILQCIHPEIFFKGQGRSLLGNPAFQLWPIYRSAAQSKYISCILYLREHSFIRSDRDPILLFVSLPACHALTLDISVFFMFLLGQGVTRVGTGSFCIV